MFKQFLTVIAIFVAMTALRADNNRCPPPCRPCPCPPDPCCEQTYGVGQGLVPVCEMQPGYNSPGRIDVCGCWDTFVTASFIYWLPQMDGLDVAMENTRFASETVEKDKMIYHDSEYDPGLKVGLGTHFDYDNWDLFAEYTWLSASSTSTNNLVAGDAATNYATWYKSTGTTGPRAAPSKWSPDIHLLDLELARSFYVGTRLVFRTHIGGRAGWLYQKFQISYIEGTSVTAQIKAKSDSWLLGPRMGLDTNWIFKNGFKIVGNIAGALTYQYFDSKVDSLTNAELGKTIKEKKGYVNPIFEIGLAVAWGTYFDNNNWFFDLSLGYDLQYIWNQNRMKFLNSVFGKNSFNPDYLKLDIGDLMLHGLTVTARFDF